MLWGYGNDPESVGFRWLVVLDLPVAGIRHGSCKGLCNALPSTPRALGSRAGWRFVSSASQISTIRKSS